jgi:thioesterase domain-containing protein
VLVPVQTSGARPPLYLVHGMLGLMPLGPFLARHLGPDQPIYGINANGINGSEVKTCDAAAMVIAYVEEVLDAQPSGPLLIGGMCAGGFIAMDMASELQARGREVGHLILLDPPAMPLGDVRANRSIDLRNPFIAAQVHERATGRLLQHDPRDIPFDTNDRQRLHLATLAGVNTMVALCKHVPKTFSGKVTAILSLQRARGFFHPRTRWAELLSQQPMAHVLPCSHDEIFKSARHDLARVLKFVLENIMHSEIRSEGRVGSTLAANLIDLSSRCEIGS